MKVMSTWKFVIFTGYCHIGSQWVRVPTHIHARQPNSEGGVGGAGPSQMKMWSSPKPITKVDDANVDTSNYVESSNGWIQSVEVKQVSNYESQPKKLKSLK